LNDLRVKSPCEKGFTLIEMMVTMVIAMVVLGGLMLSFTQQNSEYKYQGKRIDAVQDLEFAIKFTAEDLRNALVAGATPVTIVDDPAGWTENVRFWVWDEQQADANADIRARRRYVFNNVNSTLLYDRQTDAPGVEEIPLVPPYGRSGEILPNVTYFKVFEDGVTSRNVPVGHGNAGNPYSGIPSAQGQINLLDPAVNNVSGYTILIEVGVDAGYKNGSFLDVLGDDQSPGVGDGHKRIWRYIQVYPRTSVN